MKNLRIIAALPFLLFSVAYAQQGSLKIEANYTVGLPAGNLKNLTSRTSWRGGELGFMYGITDRASLGLQVGNQDFYEKFPRALIQESGSDISAVVTNSIQVMPIMLKGSWKLAPMGAIQPFVALAAGGNVIQYRKFYGEFADSRSKFGFAAQPSAGIHILFGKNSRAGFHLAAAFNYMPFKYGDADGLHHGVVKAGVSVPLQ